MALCASQNRLSTLPHRITLGLLLLASLAVSACSSGIGTTQTMSELLSRNATEQKPKIAIAPIIGAPQAVTSALNERLRISARERNIQIVGSDAADYTLRGYLATSPEKGGYKLSHIWDITDPKGARVHRVLGEDIVKGKSSDPWALVNSTVVQGVAAKTMIGVGRWLPKAGKAAGAPPKPAVASASASREPDVAAEARANAQKLRDAKAEPNKPRKVMAYVPSVIGAPGDGGKSLTAALRQRLASRGIPVAPRAGNGLYQVRGVVRMGQPAGGRQSIQIDWGVLDPTGKRLGTVSQKNQIPAGSLDGAWGKTATLAADAATKGIIELLPKQPKR